MWRSTIGCRATSPHKHSNDNIPLFRIPGLETQRVITDPLHCFHLGWGQDLAAGGLVMLAHLGHFGRGGLDAKLAQAFELFLAWCVAAGKSTSCDKFSRRDFDMK